jgi:hypothetical protein
MGLIGCWLQRNCDEKKAVLLYLARAQSWGITRKRNTVLAYPYRHFLSRRLDCIVRCHLDPCIDTHQVGRDCSILVSRSWLVLLHCVSSLHSPYSVIPRSMHSISSINRLKSNLYKQIWLNDVMHHNPNKPTCWKQSYLLEPFSGTRQPFLVSPPLTLMILRSSILWPRPSVEKRCSSHGVTSVRLQSPSLCPRLLRGEITHSKF